MITLEQIIKDIKSNCRALESQIVIVKPKTMKPITIIEKNKNKTTKPLGNGSPYRETSARSKVSISALSHF
jgi:hypothetical protein